MVLCLAVTPAIAAAQSRPGPCPPRSGGSSADIDTARAAIGVLSLLAKKAREAEAKKKEEAARKKREAEEAAARQAEADATAADVTVSNPPPAAKPATSRPVQEPAQTLSGTVARTPTPTIPPAVMPVAKLPAVTGTPKPPTPRVAPRTRAEAPPPPRPAPIAPPAAPIVVAPAPPPAVVAVAPPPPQQTAPPPPAPARTPWSEIGLGVGVFLAILAAATLAAARAFGWLAPPPSARVWVDPGSPPAPVFSPALTGPLLSLDISRGQFVSEALYPEPAG